MAATTKDLGPVKGADATINGVNAITLSPDANIQVDMYGSHIELSSPTLKQKQQKLSGTPGQCIGFDEEGNPVVEDFGYQSGVLYGIEIDETENDPAKKIKYVEQNANYAPGAVNRTTGQFNYGDWEDAWFIKNIKPVMLNYDGTVAYELNKNDYSKKLDGTASDIANDAFEGNVMIGIPTVYIKIVSVNSTKHRIYFSDHKIDKTYHAYAHTIDANNIKPYLYIAAYNGWVDSAGRMRSISGKNPTRSQAGDTQFNECAKNNPTGYTGWTMETIAARNLINLLLLLVGRNTNTQLVFGDGNTNGYNDHATGSDSYGVLPTGTMNDKGLFYGTSTTNLGVKVFGIEHWWGNIWRRIAGYFLDNGVQKIKMTPSTYDGSTTEGYNLTGEGYIALSIPQITASGNYILTQSSNKHGLFPSSCSSPASATSGWCDALWTNNAQLDMALFGGDSTNGVRCGAFACVLNFTFAGSHWNVGASPQHL